MRWRKRGLDVDCYFCNTYRPCRSNSVGGTVMPLTLLQMKLETFFVPSNGSFFLFSYTNCSWMKHKTRCFKVSFLNPFTTQNIYLKHTCVVHFPYCGFTFPSQMQATTWAFHKSPSVIGVYQQWSPLCPTDYILLVYIFMSFWPREQHRALSAPYQCLESY